MLARDYLLLELEYTRVHYYLLLESEYTHAQYMFIGIGVHACAVHELCESPMNSDLESITR